MKIGRWKDPAIFFNHYVQARPQDTTTDLILGLQIDNQLEENYPNPILSQDDPLPQSEDDDEEINEDIVEPITTELVRRSNRNRAPTQRFRPPSKIIVEESSDMDEDSQNEESTIANKTMDLSYVDGSMSFSESFVQKWNSFNSSDSPNSNLEFNTAHVTQVTPMIQPIDIGNDTDDDHIII